MPSFIHPVLQRPINALLEDLITNNLPDNAWPMKKVIPFPRYPCPKTSSPAPPPTAADWVLPLPQANPRSTRIMATLNATPDSFSDGSINNSISGALSYTTKSVAGGADIVDIGGYSTRPGAEYVSPEEEISRVVPIIEALRNHIGSEGAEAKVKDILISVDTFRYNVAKAAVLAGANCINDVYAFTGPEYPLTPASWAHLAQMRQVARDLAIPVILMHSRGDAGNNKDYSSYGTGGVLEGIRVELGKKVDAIVKGPGGIRRWLVIIDPGIGFSKTLEDNLQILRHASSLTAFRQGTRNPLYGFPQLIGASKKSFLGLILAQPDRQGTYEGRQTDPKERGWATAAAVACAIQQGAAVVRVHDALEMGDVVRVGSLLW
jgi:dihydroneopterin aldolase / 2-amino-4-hydroxy-6-hydroxymethyldihydropteridine diphosphokinase / dihydropteroate synthase